MPRSGVSFTALPARRTALVACSGRTTSVAPAILAAARCRGCLAATTIRPASANRRSAISVSRPTVPAPTTSTSPPAGTRARSAVWIAQANGSISTAARSSIASGTAQSCERCASIMRLQPPPVSAQ